MTGYQVVQQTETDACPSGVTCGFFPQALCPTGKVVLGGGATTDFGGAYLSTSAPLVIYNPNPQVFNDRWETFWVVRSDAGDGNSYHYTAVGFCANVS